MKSTFLRLFAEDNIIDKIFFKSFISFLLFAVCVDKQKHNSLSELNIGTESPTIPFPNFSKLFKTWLEVLATIDVKNREDMFSNYFKQILTSPDKIILFNLDAIFEIFLQVDNQKKQVLIASIKAVFDRLDEESKRKMNLLAPDSAKKLFNF